MSMKVHSSSGVVLRQNSQLPDPPTDSLRYHQEIRLQPEIDCYSDGGYPTLPRPKVILPLPRPSSPWNAYQASQLQTVSVRVGSGSSRENRRRSSSLSVVECNRAKYSHRAKTVNPKRSLTTKQTLKLESSEVSDHANILDDSGEWDHSGAQENNTSAICSKLKTNRVPVDTVGEIHSSSNSRAAAGKDRLTQSWSCPASQNTGHSTTTMSNHNTRRRTDSSQAPGSSKGKKPKKATRSLTFSFGSSSEKRKRSLGFFGTKPRRRSDDTGFLRIPDETGMTPGSPILVGRGRGKSRTLPSTSRSTEFQRHCIMEEQDSNSSLEDWGPDISSKNHFGSCRDLNEQSVGRPRYRTKHRPPRLSSSAERHTSHHDPLTDSPLTDGSTGDTYNTTSGRSSRRDSIESPSFSLSSEPTQQFDDDRESVEEWKKEERPRRERKLSDPASSSPDVNHPEGRKTFIKKRNTFCVRPMKQSPRPGRREMRHHVVCFLLETEQSYVQSLKTIMKIYLEPLNRPQAVGLADPTLVKDIFFQIPEVCTQHERFLRQLKDRVDHWDTEQMIGDVFVNTFSKCQLVDIYSKFIGNFMKAKAAIDIAKQSRPVFAKFLEQRAKDSQGRLALDDLLIKPVQRIPRYVLFIKDLLKHTTTDHPDHAPLQQALSELTTLAERVNASERERGRIEQQRELMMAVDGLALLLNSESRFVRYDLVTEVANTHKRDRFLILFSDVLVCASSRRKSTGFKRSSFLNLTAVFTDTLKYNIKWHVPLTRVSIAQIQALSFNKRRQNTLEKMLETLQRDEATLKQMMDMSTSIHRPHQLLVNTLRDMQTEVREDISEKKAALEDLPLETGRLDIISYAASPPTQYSLLFPSQRLKNSWEADFLKHKTTADQQAPPNDMVAPPTSPPPVPIVSHDLKFLHPMVLQSGRVGTKMTCAAEGLPVDCDSPSCLWVACSDGYGGQVSLLDLHPSTHPQVVANITVSDSPILCMSAIPAHHLQTQPSEDSSVALEPDSRGFEDSIGPLISVQAFDSDSTSNASTMSESCDGHVTDTRTPSSASDGVEVTHVNEKEDDNIPLGYLDPDLNPEATPTHDKPHPHHTLSVGFQRVRSNSAPSGLSDVNDPERQSSSSLAVGHMMKRGHQRQDSGTRLFSPLTLRPSDLGGAEGNGGCGHCMWLGTQGGQIHVYSAGDNLRSRSNRQTVQLPAAVHFIRYYNKCVYVGLGNGSLAILNPQDPTAGPSHMIPVGVAPLLSSLLVDGKLWMTSGGSLHQLEESTPANTSSPVVKAILSLPSEQTIQDMVVTEGVVLVASQQTPVIHLYSVSPLSHLTTIDCTKSVMDLLRGYNPIIRQHKSSTLQITSLLATPTHLIAGTSAGILLTLPLPSSVGPHPHNPTPLAHGHVDPVHFISSIQRAGLTLIISGGNGCEDFIASKMSQDVAETSSCLLVWTSSA